MLVDRVTYILEQCSNRRVLHLGCTDWPYTARKLATGALLHGRIAQVATSVVGVDADREGVSELRKLGYAATFEDNVEDFANEEVCKGEYDVIVAGEIIEHLPNPGLFLHSVQKLMRPATDLVVTTINAYCFFRFVYYLFGNEMVHEDHNYYFSPKVLRRLLLRCGLEILDQKYYPIGLEIRALNPRRIVLVDDVARMLFPRASDGLIFRVRLRAGQS